MEKEKITFDYDWSENIIFATGCNDATEAETAIETELKRLSEVNGWLYETTTAVDFCNGEWNARFAPTTPLDEIAKREYELELLCDIL